MKKRFAKTLAENCVAKSPARSLLQTGYYVVEIMQPGKSSLFLHVALMYMNPQRPTYVPVDLLPEKRWGRRAVYPQKGSGDSLLHLTDCQAMELITVIQLLPGRTRLDSGGIPD